MLVERSDPNAPPFILYAGHGNSFFIRSVSTGKYLNAEGAGTAEGTKVILWQKSLAQNQRWTIDGTSNGLYGTLFRNKSNQKLFSIYESGNSSILNPGTYSLDFINFNQSLIQGFLIEKEGDYHTIRVSSEGPSNYLQATNSGIVLRAKSGNNNQLWEFIPQFMGIEEDKQPGNHTLLHDRQPTSWINSNTKNWMRYLPNSIRLKNLSIPGTHDSAAMIGGFIIHPWVKTQFWNIKKQLEAGIRYLDIRTFRKDNSFGISHGTQEQDVNFGDVMKTCENFLTENGSETIIMRLAFDEKDPEKTTWPKTSSFADNFTKIRDEAARLKDPPPLSNAVFLKRYVNRFKHILYPAWRNSDFSDNPKLSDARGKVFLMVRGLDTTGLDTSERVNLQRGMVYGTGADIQDLFFIDEFASKEVDIENSKATGDGKISKIKEFLDKANDSSKWILNYISATGATEIHTLAREFNGSTYYEIGPNPGRKKLGIIIMNYPGEKLIYRIIKTNFYPLT